MSTSLRDSEAHNPKSDSVDASEDGTGSRPPVEGRGADQQPSAAAGCESQHKEGPSQCVLDQDGQSSEEADSKKENEVVKIHENPRNQTNVLCTPHNTGMPADHSADDERDVVEIDLEDMGDELDFAEIGRHCTEFGRASFNSDKKVSKDLIPVNIEDKLEDDGQKSLRSTANQVEEKIFEIAKTETLTTEDQLGKNDSINVNDDVDNDEVFAENDGEVIGNPTAIDREVRSDIPKRMTLSEANVSSSKGYDCEDLSVDNDLNKPPRRKSATDAEICVTPKNIVPIANNNDEVSTRQTQEERSGKAATVHPVDEEENRDKESRGTPILIEEADSAINDDTEAPICQDTDKKPRRKSTTDLHQPAHRGTPGDANNCESDGEMREIDSVSSVSNDKRRRKSAGDVNNFIDDVNLNNENKRNIELLHDDIMEHNQRNNLLNIHPITRTRKKSDLVTIPETETLDSVSNQEYDSQNGEVIGNEILNFNEVEANGSANDKNGIISSRNEQSPRNDEQNITTRGKNDHDSEETKSVKENESVNNDSRNKGRHEETNNEVRKISIGNEVKVTGNDCDTKQLKNESLQEYNVNPPPLPVYCAYAEEDYLEEPQHFAVDGRIHIQVTDLDDDDDDEIYVVGNGGSNGLEIDFDDLDNDIKEAFETIDNLSSGVSDGMSNKGSIRSRSSTFKIGDDSPKRRKSEEKDDNIKYNYPRMSVADAEKLAQRPSINRRMENEVLQHSSDMLSYNDVKDISSSINKATEERRAISSSITGIDLGVLKSVSRNIDLSKGSSRDDRHDSEQFSTLNRSRSQLITQSSDELLNIRIYPPSEKWRILKNLIFISLAFMILFTAFNTTQAYQSSINASRGLGSWSLVVYYFTLMVSNMFLPVIITKWLGCKGSMVASCLLFAPYIVAQFYPKFYTLLPTSAATGMGAGVLFCAQGTYASVMAETYMTVSAVDKETTMMLFFGIFFFLYLMSLVWGNLISAQVLLTGSSSPHNNPISSNLTKFCGANFCPATILTKSNENLLRPSDDQLFIIWGILLALVFVAAAVLFLGVDSLSRYNEAERAIKRGSSGCQLLAASVKHLGNPYQLLLIPVSALGSVSEGFLEADFTYGYISCAWGIPYIGYVMICYGILLLCFTLLLGCFAVRVVGRLPLMIVCFALYLGVLAALKFWAPKPEENIIFFIIAGFWGIADASTVIITAMYGIVFLGNEEAAFCNLGISRALGYLLSYVMHPLLCMDIKMIIVLVIVLVAAAGYITFEHLWKKASREKALAALVPFKGWVDIPVKSQARDEG